MSRSNSGGPAFPLLLFEDSENQRTYLKEQLESHAFGRNLQLEILEATNAEEALMYIRKKIVPFSSLDQRAQLRQSDPEVTDEAGGVVMNGIDRLYPLRFGILFTAFARHDKAVPALLTGFQYNAKEITTEALDRYTQAFVADAVSFMERTAWEEAALMLPHPLGRLSRLWSDCVVGRDFSKQLNAGVSLWEGGIRLALWCGLALLRHYGLDITPVTKGLSRYVGNAQVIYGIRKSIEALGAARLPAASEFTRFFGDSLFENGCNEVKRIRNDQAHMGVMREQVELDSLTVQAFFASLLGFSFWGKHPIVHNLKADTFAGSLALRAEVLSDAASNHIQRFQPVDRLRIDPSHLYLCVNPLQKKREGGIGAPETAEIIPLYPLCRCERRGENVRLWLAEKPREGIYRDPGDGELKQFDDTDLEDWWCKASGVGHGAEASE